ncbi:MAG TPA: DUF4157 domain-containing protein [Vicinamibacterales bacterium]|nr:DUF4157 domain-containing protein [Vicinamibacterales bacterium]
MPPIGVKIPMPLQSLLEESVGVNLSGVRLHADAESSKLANAMDARAITMGEDVHFGSGEYQPESGRGQQLIAHEIVHVAQQARAPNAGFDREPTPTAPSSGALEKEATTLASSVMRGIPVKISAAPSIVAAPQLKGGVQETDSGAPALPLQPGAPATVPGGPTPAIAPPVPIWTISSSADPLPGDPVPGYEVGKPAYRLEDYFELQAALQHREDENFQDAVGFLGDYGAAIVDLWATHATEIMAKAAEDAGWSALGKALEFVITESLIALSGVGAAVKFGHLGVEVVKLATAAAADAGFAVAERSGEHSAVQAAKEEIDAKTKVMAENLKKVAADLVKLHTGAVPYGVWLGQQYNTNFSDLGRFRIPPRFPRPDAGTVRVSVAQAIVGVLYGPSPFVFATNREQAFFGMFGSYLVPAENVVRIQLGINEKGPVKAQAILSTSDVLKKELVGHPIRELPNAPLHITLVSDEQPLAVVKAALAGMESSLRPTLRPGKNIFGGDIPGSEAPVDEAQALVDAYPTRPPMEITRDAEGRILVVGGGLVEHLYLYQRLNPDKNLRTIIGGLEDQRIAKEREEAELSEILGSEGSRPAASEMPSPEELAGEIAAELLQWTQASAEGLVNTEVIASVPLSTV